MAFSLTITFQKIVFLVQGILQLGCAVKDLCWYYGLHDVERVRLFQVSILLVFFGTVTIGLAILSCITCTSCEETKYKPIILWCIWNVLVTVLVVYQLIQVLAYEQAWSTSVIVSFTLTAALGLLMFKQIGLHIFYNTKETSNFFPNIRIAHALKKVTGKSFTRNSSYCGRSTVSGMPFTSDAACYGDKKPLVFSPDNKSSRLTLFV